MSRDLDRWIVFQKKIIGRPTLVCKMSDCAKRWCGQAADVSWENVSLAFVSILIVHFTASAEHRHCDMIGILMEIVEKNIMYKHNDVLISCHDLDRFPASLDK